MASSSRDTLQFICMLCIFLIILFLQPTLAILDQRSCNNHGYVNTETGECDCHSGWRGASCQLKFCPVGPSWVEFPVNDHERYQPKVECSNMGSCDMHTGKCTCRPGFTGRACERMDCPTNVTGKACSGHGRCMTMGEAAVDFNGLTLKRPSVTYSSWDADSLMGCICDHGYEGYDCTARVCPLGRDPTSSEVNNEETFVLECRGTSGYFSITALGHTTQPIPYDASPGLLKHLLESIPGAGTVIVEMSANPVTLLPSVCHVATARTYIWFTSFLGQRPPIRVQRKTTAATVMWPNGDQALLSTSLPILRMVTEHTLSIPPCPLCTGSLYFTYKGSISDPIDVTTTTAKDDIRNAILSLSDLISDGWGIDSFSDIYVREAGNQASLVDDASTSTWTISLRSNYGNIPFLGILDGSVYSGSDAAVNMTLSTNAGSGTLYECSNQGTCDRTTGTCKCYNKFRSGEIQYRAISSDGRGGKGSRGDCGYIEVTNAVCEGVGRDGCNGHGFCHAIGDSCVCDEGWAGLDCRTAVCPSGIAWFDEAISATEAHQMSECSNNGICDRTTGRCACRDGFSGSACQYFDCPYDENGPCSGKGWCVNMNKWAEIVGVEYGDQSNPREYPAAWDAFTFYHCMCSARTSDGFTGNPRYPTTATNAMVSGRPAESRNLYGWRGWDCSERNCPTGDTVSSPSSGAVDEIQRIICYGTAGDSFTLSFFGLSGLVISHDASASVIKEAIEYSTAVGNVTITFPNSEFDNITTACDAGMNATHGGFLVQFVTELGDLDMLVASNSTMVIVEEYRKGTKSSEECGGLSRGICNRQTGTCECTHRFGSSDGDGNQGNRGDCGYYYSGAISVEATANDIF